MQWNQIQDYLFIILNLVSMSGVTHPSKHVKYMFGKIKLDKADRMFSIFIRLRDGKCIRCGRQGDGRLGIDGLQASHYYGRGKESTRFDEANVDALCAGCHQYWGSVDREGYRTYKMQQLGQKGFDLLQVRAETYQKKDRKLAALYYSQKLKQMGIKV